MCFDVAGDNYSDEVVNDDDDDEEESEGEEEVEEDESESESEEDSEEETEQKGKHKNFNSMWGGLCFWENTGILFSRRAIKTKRKTVLDILT